MTAKIVEKPRPWLRVSIQELNRDDLVVYRYDKDFAPDELVPPDQYEPFSPSLFPRVAEFREETRAHYRSKERPLLFFRLPHALYRGSIPRSMFDIVEVR